MTKSRGKKKEAEKKTQCQSKVKLFQPNDFISCSVVNNLIGYEMDKVNQVFTIKVKLLIKVNPKSLFYVIKILTPV